MYKIPANTVLAGQRLIYVPECHSTNSLLISLNEGSAIPEGTVVITDNQTAGRGQRGNAWEATPGQNLTFSILFKPVFLAAKDQFHLNMAVSLAVAEAIEPAVNQPVKLKWPNDIMISDKKVGGILIESQLSGSRLESTVVGVGINVNQRKFSHPLASSLFTFSGIDHSLAGIFGQLMKSLDSGYMALQSDYRHLKECYVARLFRFAQEGAFRGREGDFLGTINDVDDEGRLCIQTENGLKRYMFKEVEFVH